MARPRQKEQETDEKVNRRYAVEEAIATAKDRNRRWQEGRDPRRDRDAAARQRHLAEGCSKR